LSSLAAYQLSVLTLEMRYTLDVCFYYRILMMPKWLGF
jgi:hypothetical protein